MKVDHKRKDAGDEQEIRRTEPGEREEHESADADRQDAHHDAPYGKAGHDDEQHPAGHDAPRDNGSRKDGESESPRGGGHPETELRDPAREDEDLRSGPGVPDADQDDQMKKPVDMIGLRKLAGEAPEESRRVNPLPADEASGIGFAEDEIEVRSKTAYGKAEYDHAGEEAEEEEAWEDDEEEDDDDAPVSKIGRRVGFIIAFCILFMIAGTLLGIGMFFANGLQPVEAKDEEVKITIKPGMNSAQIAQILEDNGLIRSEFVFRYYLRMTDQGKRFQAGEYVMKPGMELDEIIGMLNNGSTLRIPTFRFTIPEGYTIEKIADKLSEEGIVDRDNFLKLASQAELFAYEYVRDIPDDPHIVYKLEGYLFPETYEMKEGSSEQEIIARMISELERKLAQLPEDWSSRLEEAGISFHEMLTIASLIEREVVVDAERPIVASVIYNRLRQGMKLQIDATVQYALDEHKQTLLIVDTEVDSPYNTYQIAGLPPGPIASPGLESIRAAIYPAETKYLFYVAKKDGSQEHLFAETYDQHLRNKAAVGKK